MSVFKIPPGIRFLAPVALKLCFLPFTFIFSHRFFYSSFPTGSVVAACMLAYPLLLTALVQYEVFRKRQKAKRLGCELPPVIDHKLPGGLDTLATLKEAHEHRFPGYLPHVWLLKYGPTYNIRTLFKNRIFTCDPECIKRVLATEFVSFEKGPVFRDQFHGFLGDGVFNADGEMWKFHRAMIRPFFARDRITHFGIFHRHTEDALRQINERMEEDVPFDFQELISRLTLDCASEFLLGKDLQSLSAVLSYPPLSAKTAVASSGSISAARVFAQAFARAQHVTDLRPFYGLLWPLMEFWKDGLVEPMKNIDAFLLPLVAKALNEKKLQKVESIDVNADHEINEEETVLEHLVKFTDDSKIIKDEILNILLAGRDTTAITLTAAVYVLSVRPDILKRLRAEVLDHVGARYPTFDDIRSMKYLRAFFNEILRLYPAVPTNLRWAVSDSIWPPTQEGGKPMLVEANTEVVYSVMVMHRRTDLWGPDAAEFDPDRFLDERCQRYLIPNPFIFLPFNAGPRICLGQQFAYNEISFVLIRLLQLFTSIEIAQEEANPAAVPPPEWAMSPGTNGQDRVRFKPALVMSVQGGLWVRMKRDDLTE